MEWKTEASHLQEAERQKLLLDAIFPGRRVLAGKTTRITGFDQRITHFIDINHQFCDKLIAIEHLFLYHGFQTSLPLPANR